MSCGLPAAHIEIPPPAPITTADLELVERLVNAHEHAIRDEAGVINKPGGDVWEMVGNEFHGEFVAALRLRQIETLATILNAAFRRDICYGLGGGVMVYQTLQNAEGRAELAALTIDRLASLAEALALLPYENPEQGRWGENIYIPPVELADRIEAAIGIPVCPPDICGYFGIRIRDGFMFSQSCNQLYLATRMRQILTGNLWPRRACEIGAGYGGTAYYATLLGLTDYRIFDLPVINVLQGYYLTKALPQHRIVLYGEPTHASALWVYPYWMLKSAAAKSFGIVVNQDSFPEIAPAIVADYLTEIVRTSNCLLSINQESQGAACNPDVFQNLVPRMADQNPGLRRVSRFPFWLRRGYVEEVYYTAERNEPALKRMTKNCIRRLTGR